MPAADWSHRQTRLAQDELSWTAHSLLCPPNLRTFWLVYGRKRKLSLQKGQPRRKVRALLSQDQLWDLLMEPSSANADRWTQETNWLSTNQRKIHSSNQETNDWQVGVVMFPERMEPWSWTSLALSLPLPNPAVWTPWASVSLLITSREVKGPYVQGSSWILGKLRTDPGRPAMTTSSRMWVCARSGRSSQDSRVKQWFFSFFKIP